MKILSPDSVSPDEDSQKSKQDISRRNLITKLPLIMAGAVTGVLSSSEETEAMKELEVQKTFETITWIEELRAKFNRIDETKFKAVSKKSIARLNITLIRFINEEYKNNDNLTSLPQRTGESRKDLNMMINFICTEYTLGCVETLINKKSFNKQDIKNYLKRHFFTFFEKTLKERDLI